jgi:hypothetical protein
MHLVVTNTVHTYIHTYIHTYEGASKIFRMRQRNNNKHSSRSNTKGYGGKTHKIAIQLHLVTESSTICSSRFKRPVRKLLDTPFPRALGYGLDDRWFESRQTLGIFLFTTVSRPALGPTEPPMQGVPEVLSLGVKRPRCEADHSNSPCADVENAWRYTSTPSIRLNGVVYS